MRIEYFTPTSSDKNLGAAYNYSMSLLRSDNDWGVLRDGDTMFIQPNYGQLVELAIQAAPDTAMFTCLTNRVGDKRQTYKGKIDPEPSMLIHRQNAIDCEQENMFQYPKINHMISGHFMAMQKKTWKEFKFKDGLLGIDNDISKRLLLAGRDIRIIRCLYLLHYYRLAEGTTYKKHLK